MADNTVIEVDPYAPKMGEEEFIEAVNAMGGTIVHEGENFDRLACIANDADRARHAFIATMTQKLSNNGDVELIWRWRPTVGTRRSGGTIQWVASARFQIVRVE